MLEPSERITEVLFGLIMFLASKAFAG